MKVLLLKDISGLGRSGDIKEVSDGHARNFLIPRKLVLPADKPLVAKVQKERQEKQASARKQHQKHLDQKQQLESKTFIAKGKAAGNNLFAAIHERDIAQIINEKTGLSILPENISISKPVKSLGIHKINLKLEQGLNATINLNVESI